MDASVLAVGLTAVSNVLFLGFIYGKMSTQLANLSVELRAYVRRTDGTILRLERDVRDHETRIAVLEARHARQGGLA